MKLGELTPAERPLAELLIRHGHAIARQHAQLRRAQGQDCQVVVPESFDEQIVVGARFMGMPLVRGRVEAPMVEVA